MNAPCTHWHGVAMNLGILSNGNKLHDDAGSCTCADFIELCIEFGPFYANRIVGGESIIWKGAFSVHKRSICRKVRAFIYSIILF